MGADQGMGRRKRADGLEEDAFSKYGRRVLCFLANRSDMIAYAKRKANRRERRAGKREARREQ